MCAFVLGAAALATRSDDAVSGVLVCGPGARHAIVWGTTIAEHRPEGEGGTDRGAPGWLIRSIAHRILQGGESPGPHLLCTRVRTSGYGMSGSEDGVRWRAVYGGRMHCARQKRENEVGAWSRTRIPGDGGGPRLSQHQQATGDTWTHAP